jgi:polyisoprenoid-binding protein YceI
MLLVLLTITFYICLDLKTYKMRKIILLIAMAISSLGYAQDLSVTLSVDMNNYCGAEITTLYVSGTFNSWSGDANPMTDANADGVYDVTLSLPAGTDSILYKFQGNQWAIQESFAPGDPCTVTADGFTNRVLLFDGDTTLATVCWNECDACVVNTLEQIQLDIDWEGDLVDYSTSDFGGTSSVVDVDPADSGNDALKTIKSGSAQTWAGTTLSTPCGFAEAIPFDASNNSISVKVYSPIIGAVVRLKAEDHTDPTKSVETEATTTVANEWETLTFDFSNEVTGTAAINYTYTYDMLSIFFNFGVDGATAGEQTYYSDDVTFVEGVVGTTVDVTFSVDMNNFCGSTINTLYVSGTFNNWSANANPMTDDNTDGVYEVTVSLPSETDSILYKFQANEWAIQESFSPGDPCTITADGFTNRILLFSGDTTLSTVCWNECSACVISDLEQIQLDIDWEGDLIDYSTSDFGENSSSVDVDPADSGNNVLKTIRSATAPTWAGTTLSTPCGFAEAIPFDADNNAISVNVYSPVAGAIIRLKAEDHTDPTKSVETEATTTVADAWETLTFDFSNEATGTAAINYTYTYDMLSIFYNFGVEGTVAGEQTYYCDDVNFGGEVIDTSVDVTFKVDMSEYTGSYTTVNLNGTFNNWCGACAVMNDDDADDVYEITVNLPVNEAIEYKFTVDGWTDQEMLTEGSSCTITSDGFTNRTITPASDSTLNVVCWGACTSCENTQPMVDVTFRVDMSQYTETFTTVNLNGVFNGWCGTCAVMTDDDMDDVYEITISLTSADTVEYKFTLDGWNVQEEFEPGTECTSTIDGFTNRSLVPSSDTLLTAVCWNYCVTCLSLDVDEVNWLNDFVIAPNPSNGMFIIRGELNNATKVTINVTDIQGKIVFQSDETSSVINKTVDLNHVENGMYFINISSEYGRFSDKILLLK